MKYEIIKGNEKDFEGAPEWALIRDKSGVKEYFSSGLDEGCLFVVVGDESGRVLEFTGKYPNTKIIAERRPITEPVVWLNLDGCDGSEYLGPVIGKEMECHAKDGSIFVVVVVAFDGDLPIVKTKLHGNYFGCEPSQLFHIRSPEYVAREEFGAAVAGYLDVRPNGVRMSELYDAIAAGKIPGLTKTPTASELMRVTEKATREDCEAIVKLLSGK